MKRILAGLLILALAAPAQAFQFNRKTHDYIAANLIAVLYHEFGHALIDVLKLPIFGQEEDAADVLSVVLIHEFFEESSAVQIAYATAHGFLGEEVTAAERRNASYWDVHGPDVQRYYTFVCLFYGADIQRRRQFAIDLKLPKERMSTCDDEYAQADESWGKVIRDLRQAGGGQSIRILADHKTDDFGKLTFDVMSDETAALNKVLTLPKRLLVRVEPCDTVNAFYDGKTREIIMCSEFAGYLARHAPR